MACNARFDFYKSVQCPFCWDEEPDPGRYGFLCLNGLIFPSCQPCAQRILPELDLQKWHVTSTHLANIRQQRNRCYRPFAS